MIEAGGRHLQKPEDQFQYQGVGDLEQDYFTAHSQQVLGGTSSVWNGYCTTFEERSFLATGTRWPISYAEVKPFYAEASTYLDLPKEAWSNPSQQLADGILFKPFYLSPPTRFGSKFSSEIKKSKNLDVLLNADVKSLERDSKGTIKNILVTMSDQTINISSNLVVLACGGLGNPRLMLASGFENPRIGRYLADHPHVYGAGKILFHKKFLSNLDCKQGIRCVPALQISDAVCLKEGIQSFSVSIESPQKTESSAIAALHGWKQAECLEANVTIRAEMENFRENALQRTMPFDKVNFKFTEHTEQKLNRAWNVLSRLLVRQNIGRLTQLDNEYKIRGGGHLIGTTMMGKNTEDSVVDPDCKVHGTSNLYLAGSSIFPHAHAANPTFSIVAFACRLAKHLKENKL
jgi:choline dehydrogenase-like flavoprotein